MVKSRKEQRNVLEIVDESSDEDGDEDGLEQYEYEEWKTFVNGMQDSRSLIGQTQNI